MNNSFDQKDMQDEDEQIQDGEDEIIQTQPIPVINKAISKKTDQKAPNRYQTSINNLKKYQEQKKQASYQKAQEKQMDNVKHITAGKLKTGSVPLARSVPPATQNKINSHKRKTWDPRNKILAISVPTLLNKDASKYKRYRVFMMYQTPDGHIRKHNQNFGDVRKTYVVDQKNLSHTDKLQKQLITKINNKQSLTPVEAAFYDLLVLNYGENIADNFASLQKDLFLGKFN